MTRTRAGAKAKAPTKAKAPMKAKAPTKAKPKATSRADFPYLHIGHGSSRCSDDFSIWLLFAEAPAEAERVAIEASIPEALREQARGENGSLRWLGPMLWVNSGPDFEYCIAVYDENHLAWLDDKLTTGEPLSQSDVARIERGVMNESLSGPRKRRRTVWDAFNADIEHWLAATAAKHALRLVIKDTTRDAHTTTWHRWSADHALARLTDLPARLRTFAESADDAFGFVQPLLRAALEASPAKTLTPAHREACIELLGLEGNVIAPALLAELVASLPPKERAGFVRSLLAAHHGSVVGLFVAGPTKQLLLDDAVYATALEHAAHFTVPFWNWLNPREAFLRALKKRDDATKTWGRRVLALIEANGELAKSAREEEASGTTSIHARLQQKALETLRNELA